MFVQKGKAMITIIIGLVPAALLRWLILRNPLSKGISISISAAIWIIGFFSLTAFGVKNNQLIGSTIGPIAVISYFIFRSGSNTISHFIFRSGRNTKKSEP